MEKNIDMFYTATQDSIANDNINRFINLNIKPEIKHWHIFVVIAKKETKNYQQLY